MLNISSGKISPTSWRFRVEESWAQQIKCGRKLGTANKVRKDDWQKECRRKGEGESIVDP